MTEPIADETRSILDGHIILSRKLAAASHYPAIDVLRSASRVMDRVISREHYKQAQQLRKWLAKYEEIELLLQIGEYQPGNDELADEAIKRYPRIQSWLCQSTDEKSRYEQTLNQLATISQ